MHFTPSNFLHDLLNGKYIIKRKRIKKSCEKIHLQFDWLNMFLTRLNDPFFYPNSFLTKKPDWLDLNYIPPILPRLPHPPPNHFKLYAHVLTHQSIPPSSLPNNLELIWSLAKMTLKIKILRGVKLDSMFHFHLFILCFMICFCYFKFLNNMLG